MLKRITNYNEKKMITIEFSVFLVSVLNEVNVLKLFKIIFKLKFSHLILINLFNPI
jgi:hypothetical protein